MEYNKVIAEIALKFGYDDELKEALEKIVPAMLDGKSNEEAKVLFDTLNRVKIFTFENKPTKDDIDEVLDSLRTIPKRVEFVSENNGEYDKGDRSVGEGAYSNEPEFDENFNIVNRIGFLYTTKLNENSQLKDVYGTRINLSHLVHELGHAMASQVNEFSQDENGNYSVRVGSMNQKVILDKQNGIAKESKYNNIYMEEILNTIEEEDIMTKVLNLDSPDDLKKLPGYIPSAYQGMGVSIMREYIKKFSKEPFYKSRFLDDNSGIQYINEKVASTQEYKEITEDGYNNKKREVFDKVNQLEVDQDTIVNINNFFKKYEDVYFKNNMDVLPIDKLDNVFEQIFNFSSIKYNFNIIKFDMATMKMENNENNRKIYEEVFSTIAREGYAPVKNIQKEEVHQEKVENIEEKKENTLRDSLSKGINSDAEMLNSVINRNNDKDLKKQIEDIQRD